jgi:amino-acid N-acetyltransferase
MSGLGTISVRAFKAADFDTVRDLLSAAHLPTEDLDNAPGLRLWVAEEDDRIVGAIGLEFHGPGALLRSLVVAPSHRGRRIGSTLIATLEHALRSHFTEILVLLTETAEAFFRRHGFEVIERDRVPDEVQRSAEFQSLCPASAVCMGKVLPFAPAGMRHE